MEKKGFKVIQAESVETGYKLWQKIHHQRLLLIDLSVYNDGNGLKGS